MTFDATRPTPPTLPHSDLCLRDSFERANLAPCLPSFQRFVAMAHGDAWRSLNSPCTRVDAARAMLALGELADALGAMEARVRPWDASRRAAAAG